jgi:hypothetical protein
MRPEDDLLLCLSRVNIDSERAEKIKILLQNDIDWSYLIQLALRHGLMPLLYRNLKTTHPDAVPKGTLEQLRKYFLINASRNIYLTQELIKLLHLLEKDGIVAITYKGPAMAACIYGDITLRQFCDLDILIQEKDVPGARKLLISQGYRPTLTFQNAVEEKVYFQAPFKRSLHFGREDGKVPLDLHWGVESKYLSFASDLDLFEHLEETSLDGHLIKTINLDYLIFLICLHGAQHAWAQINWICDMAELIKRRGDIEWGRIIDRSGSLGIRRMVSCGFLLTALLLEVEPQEEVLRQIKADPLVQSIVGQVVRRLFHGNGDGAGRFEREIFYLRIMERLADKARYCFYLVIPPTHAEWSTLPLFTHLHPVYYFLRPLRLIGKYSLGLLKKGTGYFLKG